METVNRQLHCARTSQKFKPAFAVRNKKPSDPEFIQGINIGHEIWPLPPQGLLTLHQDDQMQGYWKRVIDLLHNPVQSRKISGGRQLSQVLGYALILHSQNGELQPYIWSASIKNTQAVKVLANEMSITEIPQGFAWLMHLCELAKAHRSATQVTQVTDKVKTSDVSAYFDWMFDVFKRRIKYEFDMRAVRQKIRVALGFNPLAWKMAHRVALSFAIADKASMQAYNEVLSNLTEYCQIDKDCSAVLPLYVHLRPQMLSKYGIQVLNDKPLWALKDYLSGEGLEPRTWRLAVKSGGRIAKLASIFYEGPQYASTLDVLHILQKLNVSEMPSRRLCQALWGTNGHAFARRDTYRSWVLSPFMTNLGHLLQLAQRTPPESLSDIDLYNIIIYLTVPWREMLDRRQRQLGLPYLLQKAREHDENQKKCIAAGAFSWPAAFSPQTFEGLHFKCLASTQELIEVGNVMRNCLSNQSRRYSMNQEIVVYVTTPQGKRLAVFQMRRKHLGWELGSALGPMNRTLPFELFEKIRAFTRHLSQAFKSPQRIEV